MEFTFLMPCLNEEKTIMACIKEIKKYIDDHNLDAEILVADNGSTDGSVKIALGEGARVVSTKEKGYGNALRLGINNAKGKYVIMGDCDGSYDFSKLDDFVDRLRDGAALVVGNRFTKDMEKGAMPFSHKYIGIPFLSFVGRRKYGVAIRDFHCGIRGFDRKIAQKLHFQTEGMEFATEMIGAFAKAGYRIDEVPVHFRRDGRDGTSHLRSIPDGMRHLRYMLIDRTSKNNLLKSMLSYLFIMLIAGTVMALFLFGSANIKRSSIQEKMEESADYLAGKDSKLFPEMIDGMEQTKIDYYADSILLGIAWQYDDKKTVKTVMESAYYSNERKNVNINLQDAIRWKEAANQEYIRYWHGSNAIVRPLHLFLNIKQIYILNAVILTLLFVLLIWLLIKNRFLLAAVAYIAGLAGVGAVYVPFCLEYTWMFLVMSVTAIIVSLCAIKGKVSVLPKCFLVTGMASSFLDFLTVETLTLTVPLVLASYIIHNAGAVESKKSIKNAFMCSLSWLTGYIVMWVSKWVLASFALGINAFSYVGGSIHERTGGDIGLSLFEYLGGAISKNFMCLFPVGYGIAGVILTVVLVALSIYFGFSFRNNKVDKRYLAILISLALVPYVRYLVLHNHSYIHYFFTYRAQMVTIMSMVFIIAETVKVRKKEMPL